MALFAQPATEAVELSQRFAHMVGAKPTYAVFTRVKRQACDECIAWLHEHHGHGPIARSAAHTRKHGNDTLRLCRAHTDLWRARDKATAAK